MKSTKVCRKCNKRKLTKYFYTHQNTSDRLRSECIKCWTSQCKDYFEVNKDHMIRKRRDYHYRRNYGITLLDYERKLKEQDSRCKICNRQTKLVLDHNHKTGHVRHLLCDSCNHGLGMFKDDIDLLKKAVEYLNEVH